MPWGTWKPTCVQRTERVLATSKSFDDLAVWTSSWSPQARAHSRGPSNEEMSKKSELDAEEQT